MAVPFNNEEEESEEQMERLHQLFAQFIQVLTQILDQLQNPPPLPPRSSRLASCGDADDEDGDEEDDDDEEPAAAVALAVEAPRQLPDLVPRPAPRLSLATPRPAPRQDVPAVQTKWPARSAFTKYITGAPRVPVAESRTTCCFNLPDVVRDAVDPAPVAAPVAAPSAAPCPAPAATLGAAPTAAPSPAPRRLGGPAPARCLPQGPRPTPPRPAPPRPTPSKRRPSKTSEAQLLAAELAAAVTKCAGPAPCAAPSLRHQWMRQREDDLEKIVKVAASGPGTVAVRNDEWVVLGNNLRELADCFDKTLTSAADVVDGPAAPKTSLLGMLLPPVGKGSLETKFITTAIVLLYCGRGLFHYFRR